MLVYDLAGHEAHCLNRLAALVWQRCDGRRTVDDLTALLRSDLGAQVDDDVVRTALAELDRCGLLEQAPAGQWAPRLTRRQLVRRLGIATAAIALPVVTSLAAPTAAQAASCAGLGASCATLPCCAGLNCVTVLGVSTCSV